MKLSIMDYHQPTAVAYGLNMDDLLFLGTLGYTTEQNR